MYGFGGLLYIVEDLQRETLYFKAKNRYQIIFILESSVLPLQRQGYKGSWTFEEGGTEMLPAIKARMWRRSRRSRRPVGSISSKSLRGNERSSGGRFFLIGGFLPIIDILLRCSLSLEFLLSIGNFPVELNMVRWWWSSRHPM